MGLFYVMVWEDTVNSVRESKGQEVAGYSVPTVGEQKRWMLALSSHTQCLF